MVLEIPDTTGEPVPQPRPSRVASTDEQGLWRFCTAPMMDWSDRHCRFFWRLLSRRARLYTEMVTTGALLHGDAGRHLDFDPAELPLALQLGGSDPKELATCTRMAENWGYSEVNLNCGCPSDRVRNGAFGACLMLRPQAVKSSLEAMLDACSIPITVKHRLGVDAMDSYQEFRDFVACVSESGCKVFVIHARHAWLKGLSPKENREVPPLRHEWVYQLKREMPALTVVLNGGINSLDEGMAHLGELDGVMLGRRAYQDPWVLANVDQLFFGEDNPTQCREQVLASLEPYIEGVLRRGGRLNHVTRHVLGLYQCVPGARRFRRYLSTHAHRDGAAVETLKAARAQLVDRAA
ncbi:MAG: tRNA dihydrouridine(20/20a) synthase DusA [Pseudomonadota bacterium]